MKQFNIAYLLIFLCFIVLISCGDASMSNVSANSEDKKSSILDRNNPKDKLSKQEVLDRMNKANQDKSQVDDSVEKMVSDKKSQGGRIGADQAEQSSNLARQRYEKVKNKPATKEQKKVADKICQCLERNKFFKPIENANSANEIVKLIGNDKDKEVEALQKCYNENMVPAVNNLGEDAGIFAMKSRVYLNKNCLDGTDKFWISIGAYLKRNAKPAEVEINMPEMEKNFFKKQ